MAFEVNDKAQVSAYRHLIEHVQDTVLRLSTDGNILVASRSSETLFGCPRYQVTGARLAERLHIMDRPAFLTALADAAQDGRNRLIELRLRQDDPHARSNIPRFLWVEMQLSPIIDDSTGDNHRDVIALLRDITARKDAEAAMAEARRVAEDASQAKSRFLATIGHELRTPLNAVVGFSEMMSSGIGGDLSPTHKEYAGLIQQSGKHLLEVVSMLLDMSRIEAGKFDIQADSMDAGAIIPACFAMVETLAQERNVRLVSEIEPGLPLISADERVCRQIVINLLSNAVKFSHEGGLVTVAVKRQGQSINFSVKDRGIGMAPADMARIGEPFFQAQDGLSRKYEGTGLGLAISKRLVELMDGQMWLDSVYGEGSVFGFKIQLGVQDVNGVSLPALTENVSRAMVVDGIGQQREILQKQLGHLGLQVDCFGNGADALEHFRTDSNYDLILTDVAMAGMQGVELANNLRDLGYTGSLIAMCPRRLDSSFKQDRAIFNASFQKPALRSDLYKSLNMYYEVTDDSPFFKEIDTRQSKLERGTLNILLAEDNKTNQLVFTKMLKSADVVLRIAVNGLELVEMAASQRPDIIVTDIAMPEMDGIEATEIIRASEDLDKAPPIPILALTAHAMPGDREKFLSVGMDDYLTKPLKKDVVLAKLSEMADLMDQRQEAFQKAQVKLLKQAR